MPQKLAAEFIGTFAFVFVASGSLCADQYLRAASAAPLGWLGVSLAIGIAYAVLIAALAHISGAHL
ncbi:MAG: aquaporin, partial [Candidatus Acidiferrales bacterium]